MAASGVEAVSYRLSAFSSVFAAASAAASRRIELIAES
jgi:hypothetical protein